jgi:hypothetical protein
LTIARQIAAVNSNYENATRTREFISFAKYLLASKGGPALALRYAQENRASPGVLNQLKAAVAAGTTDTSDWASPLATFSTEFVASLAPFGAWDLIWAGNGFTKMPMRSRTAVITVATSGSSVDEARPKPITKFQFNNPTLDPHKSTAIVVVTEELAKSAAANALTLLGNELRKGLSRATDVDFFRRIIENGDVDVVPSSGSTADAVINDLTTALVLIDIGANSKVYICAPPKILRSWSLLRGASGAPVFPDLTILNGTINGAIVAPTDALTDTVVIVDARQIVADTGPILLDASSQTSLQLDDDPSDGAQKVTSLWQDNLRALRAERFWASALLRPTAAAVISNVTIGTSTGT